MNSTNDNPNQTPAELRRQLNDDFYKLLEERMERAEHDLAKGTFADLDNKTVNWPKLYYEMAELFNQQLTARLQAVMDTAPVPKDSPSSSDPDVHEVATKHYEQGWNDCRFLFKEAIQAQMPGGE